MSYEDPDDAEPILEHVADIWNPKAKAIGRVIMDLSRAEDGDYAIEVTAPGEDGEEDLVLASGSISYVSTTPEDYLEIDSLPGAALEYRGKGWGLVLYFGAALAAKSVGMRGIASPDGLRNYHSNRLWEALKKHGLAGRIYHDHPHFKQHYNVLLAEDVEETGLLR